MGEAPVVEISFKHVVIISARIMTIVQQNQFYRLLAMPDWAGWYRYWGDRNQVDLGASKASQDQAHRM